MTANSQPKTTLEQALETGDIHAMSCDLLVLAPHPDDAELHTGGIIASHVRQGARVAIVDLTRGEGASRGTAEVRDQEARQAAAILGLTARTNCGLPDGGLDANNPAHLQTVVAAIRQLKPRMILTMVEQVRHPDHKACHHLGIAAAKSASIHGFRTPGGEAAIPAPKVLCYEAELPITPGLLVPLTEADVVQKRAALDAHASQFTPNAELPATAISDPAFLAWIDHRGRNWGYHAKAAYAEALWSPESIQIADLRSI